MKTSPAAFVTTHWSQLNLADADTENCQQALIYLCQNYWYPLFAFACYNGMAEKDAEDATQSFFYDIIHNQDLRGADPKKGRFRTYLIGAFKKHLVDQYRQKSAQKRGGQQTIIEIDGLTAAEAYQVERELYSTADDLYDGVWAQQILDQAFSRLEEDYKERDKSLLFKVLSPVLTSRTQDVDVEHLALQIGMSKVATYQAIVRIRQRWKSYICEVVGETLTDPSQQKIMEELQYLLKCLKNR